MDENVEKQVIQIIIWVGKFDFFTITVEVASPQSPVAIDHTIVHAEPCIVVAIVEGSTKVEHRHIRVGKIYQLLICYF